jgi:two-component system sensor histidine kinase/response regulator
VKKKKILIVDDEVDMLRILRRTLSIAGYSVIKTTNGKDAIIRAKKEHPNLIILDIAMPDMGGGETANILKNDPSTKDIPIIFLTCLLTKDEEEKDIGSSYFVAKPYDPDKLLKEVSKHLEDCSEKEKDIDYR